MPNSHFVTIFESNLIKIREILPDILEFIKNNYLYISEETLFELRIIFSELLANAIIHGNKSDIAKKIELIINIEQDEIISQIKDEGTGFNFLKEKDRYSHHTSILKESGRGLLLVFSLTETLQINETGNVVEFHKKILSNETIKQY